MLHGGELRMALSCEGMSGEFRKALSCEGMSMEFRMALSCVTWWEVPYGFIM